MPVPRVLSIAGSDSGGGADAVKPGIIPSPALIEVVAAKVRECRLTPLVVDSVMVSRAGSPLLRPEAMGALRTHLLTAITRARLFITRAVRSSLPLGRGFGPANPMTAVWRT